MLAKIFPLSSMSTTIKGLIISLVIYFLGDAVLGFAVGMLAKIPILGIIFGIVGSLLGLYCLCGAVISLLIYLKVIK